MTTVSNEQIKGMAPVITKIDGDTFAVIHGKSKPSIKIYRKGDDSWEYVTWVGALAVKVLRQSAKDGLL